MKYRIISDEINGKGELIEKKAQPFGNSSHVILPREYVGKDLIIIVPSEESVYTNSDEF